MRRVKVRAHRRRGTHGVRSHARGVDREYASAATLPLPPALLRSVRKRRIGTIDGFGIWTVDGEAIRNRIYQDFVAGGNEARYPWVPKGDLWIEQTLSPTDAVGVLVHEYVETKAMLRGASYSEGHDRANVAEGKIRRAQESGHLSKPRSVIDAVAMAKSLIARSP